MFENNIKGDGGFVKMKNRRGIWYKAAMFIMLFSIIFNYSYQIFASDNLVELIDDSKEEIALYDLNDEIIGFYYQLSDGGYLICDSSNGEILEYSFNNQEIYDNEKKQYYLGPLQHYEEYDENSVVDIEDIDNSVIKEDTFVKKESTNVKEENKYSGRYPDGSEEAIGAVWCSEENSIKHLTVAVDNNYRGTCGSTAGTILLLYYYDYINRRMISQTERKNYNTLTTKLIRYIEPDYGGSNYSSLTKGLNNFQASRGLSKTFDYKTFNCFSKLKKYIDAGKPVIAGLKSKTPAYGSHWVVATGYSICACSKPDATTYVKFIQVNDGWGNTGVYINVKYCDGIVYTTAGYRYK